MWVIRANILDREYVHEELGQLVQRRRVVAELFAHHAGTGCGRGHDHLVPVKHAREPPRKRPTLIGVAAVQVHLPAAGLLLGELHLVPRAAPGAARPLRPVEGKSVSPRQVTKRPTRTDLEFPRFM